MSRIKPPRKPKGEDLSITVANQDRQIVLLLDRIEELRKECDYRQVQQERAQESFKSERAIFDESARDYNAKSIANYRLLGWQDCAREVIQMMLDSK